MSCFGPPVGRRMDRVTTDRLGSWRESFESRSDLEAGVLGCERAASDPDSVVCRLDDRLTVVGVEGEFREAESEGDLL